VRLKLVSVGKERSDPTAPLVAEYAGRIRKFVPFEEVVLKLDTAQRIAERMRRESEKSDLLVALDERGEQVTSRELAAMVG